MKSPSKIGIAVRKQNNKIVTKTQKNKEENSKLAKIPFIRGVIKLIYMLKTGIKALTWSSNQFYEEEEELSNKELVFIVLTSIIVSVVFFTLIPYLITSIKITETSSPILFNLIDGILKIIIFIVYILIISRMSEVKRLFEYHGAEHKVVNCYENDQELTPENVQKFSKIHTRCGTQFLFILFFVNVLLFSILPSLLNLIFVNFTLLNVYLKKTILCMLRTLFIPGVAGMSYEFLKLSDKFSNNIIIKALILPGLLIQKLTTNEPEKNQIEVAIKAFKLVN